MEKKFKRTGIFIIDEDVWKVAKFKAKFSNYQSVSHYLFGLIENDLGEDLETMKRFLKVGDQKEVPE